MAELEALEQEEVDGQILDVGTTIDIDAPAVPRNEPVLRQRAARNEVDELAQLRAEMAM